jgi:hypothetical protein
LSDENGNEPQASDEVEPSAGEGQRSLTYWDNLTRARQAIATSKEARAEFRSNPQAFLQRYGVDLDAMMGVGGGQQRSARVSSRAGEIEIDVELASSKAWSAVMVVAGAATQAAAAVTAVALASSTTDSQTAASAAGCG